MLTADGGRQTADGSDRTAYSVRRTAYGFFCVLLALGALQAAWYRRTLNPDGVAYLDLSDEVLAGRWGELVQAYWSPLYPVLLAGARALAGRDALHETAIAHGVNFAGFLFALAGWHLLLKAVGRRGSGLLALATPLGVAAGYAVFAWAMLWLMSLHFVTPDLWLSGWIFVASALVWRHAEDGRSRQSLALGLALGAGYLTKSVLFPVAPFFIAGAVLVSPSARRWRAALLASVAFATLAGPWAAAISVREGRLTFGDSGRFTYAWYMTGDRWLSPDPQRETGPGAAVFPQVIAAPATYAWPDAPGTYAPWRDPSSWHGRMEVEFDMARQEQALGSTLRFFRIYLAPWGLLLVVVLAAGAKGNLAEWRAPLAMVGPSMIGLAGYALVHVEGRLVAPFLALFLLAVPCLLSEPPTNSTRRVALAAALGAVLWAAIGIRIPSVLELAWGLLLYLVLVSRGARPARLTAITTLAMVTLGGVHVVSRAAGEAALLVASQAAIDPALEVRTALEAELFPEGRRIGVIADGPNAAVWAREVRARIVAEIPASQAAAFWSSSDEARAAVGRAMRAAGAQEIIASGAVPEGPLPTGWHRVSGRGLARYALDAP